MGDFTFLYTVWFYCVDLLNAEEVKAGIRDKLEKSQEMVSVGEQRELYFQLLVLQSLKEDDLQNQMPPLRKITNDLEKWRKEVIKNQYTSRASILTQDMDVTKISNNFKGVSELSR